MPDAVMMSAYPAVKPLNAKGYATRLYASTDVVVMLVPSAVVVTAEQPSLKVSIAPLNVTSPQDSGRTDVAAPAPTAVATESASAAIRGV